MAKASKIISRQARDSRTAIGQSLKWRIAQLYPPSAFSKSDAYERVGRDAGGLSVSTMRRLVAGDVSATGDTLANLAHVLGCSVAELVAGPPKRPHAEARPGTIPN